MSSSKVTPFYQDVDGFRIPGYFSVDAYRSALAYEPRPDDLFIVTYPKCGTTWVQNILACMFHQGEPFRDAIEYFSQSPFLEKAGAKAAVTMVRPGAIKVHLPFQLTPYSPEAKYIFVARNPKDCCVSFYHHTKSIVGYKFDKGNFDDYFELFIRGEVDFGDYFDTLMSWYEHRSDPNVLFLTYEQLKEDNKKYVLEIAGFVGDKYKEELEKDPDLLDRVIKHSSFAHLKDSMNRHLAELENTPKELIAKNPDLPKGIKETLLLDFPIYRNKESSVNFIRKGIVGDWRNHLSEEQNRRLEEKFEQRTRGTEIPRLWEKHM